MLRGSIKDNFRLGIAPSDRLNELLGCGGEVEALRSLPLDAPEDAPHAFDLLPSAERATELGHPIPLPSPSSSDAEQRKGEGRGVEGHVVMFGSTRELFRSRCCLRLPGGVWSDGFYLGSLAAGGVVAVEERETM